MLTKKKEKNRTGRIKKIYFTYFGCKIGDQDKRWAQTAPGSLERSNQLDFLLYL